MIRNKNIDPASHCSEQLLEFSLSAAAASFNIGQTFGDCPAVDIIELGAAMSTVTGTTPTLDVIVGTSTSDTGQNAAIPPVHGNASALVFANSVSPPGTSYRLTAAGVRTFRPLRPLRIPASFKNDVVDKDKHTTILRLQATIGGTTPAYTGRVWCRCRPLTPSEI